MRTRSLFLTLVLVAAMILPSAGLAATDAIKLVVNGREIPSDPPPQIINGTTLVPLRFVAEALGASVSYDPGGPGVVIVHPGQGRFYLHLQQGTLTLPDGTVQSLAVPAQIIDSRTFVPLRLVAESFGANVAWDGASRTVTITLAAPRVGSQPPGTGTQPPRPGMQPPTPGTQPPGTGTQPPATQPPATGTQPPATGTAPAGSTAGQPQGVSASWGPEIEYGSAGAAAGGSVGRTMVVDAEDRIHIVYNYLSGTTHRAYYARSGDGGQTWTSPFDLAQGSRLPASGPNIALGPDGVLHAVWNGKRDGGVSHLFYSRSPDGGATWGSPRDLTPAAARDTVGPSISVDTQNRVHLAWHLGNPDKDQTPTEAYYIRSTDGGQTWETAQRLNTGTGHAAWLRFSVEGTSGDLVAIAWRDNRRNPDWDVYVAVSTDGGRSFTEQVGQATGGVRDWDPEAVVDAHGVIHLSYMFYKDGISIRYQRSTDQGRTWTAPLTMTDVRSRFPSWTADNARGVLWLFWKDERDAGLGDENPRADVAGRYSLDGGKTWSELELVTDLGDVDVRFPSFTLGADGRPYVYWSDLRHGQDAEAVFLRIRSAPATAP